MLTKTPRALIADDQPDVTEALRLLLKQDGYQTESVHSSRAVLESLTAHNFDLILMDLNYARDTTSGQEGLDLLGRIGALDAGLPVVVMTAWANIPLAVEAMRRGARDFVEKPWDNSQLLSTLRQQIEGVPSARTDAREELRDAVSTQQALLPKTIPQIPGCDIAVSWTPARGVSGDYLDLLPLGGDRWGISVGDVAGKGVPAALLMSNLQALVRALAPETVEPASLTSRVNRIISANIETNKFITLFYGVMEGRRLTYTNAGHPAPILIRASGEHERLDAGGTVLGIFPDWAYQQAEIELRAGDRLLLFTDGMVEAENQGGVEFGEGRLLEMVAAHRKLDATRLRQKLMAALGDFTGGAFQDDATLVIFAME